MSSTSADMDSLSSGCSICHTNPPKYRCPRCSTQTCSLECSKRHKKLALCSGVRNPASYLKRHELATPSAFDRDYNFLVGIERGREVAERVLGNALEREGGGGNGGGRRGRHGGPQQQQHQLSKGAAALETEYRELGLRVRRAPVGMQRRRRNDTKWLQKKNAILWTVEWIDESGGASYDSLLDSTPIKEGYERYTASEQKRQRRRREEGQKHSVPKAQPKAERQQPHQAPVQGDTNTTTHVSNTPRSMYFYLRLPERSVGSKKCIMPLSEDSTLKKALRRRVIDEFPTIEVLSKGPRALDEGRYVIHEEDEKRGGGAGAGTGLMDEIMRMGNAKQDESAGM